MFQSLDELTVNTVSLVWASAVLRIVTLEIAQEKKFPLELRSSRKKQKKRQRP